MVTNEMGFTTMANINIVLHHGEVGGDITSQNLTGEKDLLEMKVWGNLLLMKGGKTDCQSDQKFNCKVPSGYDTKIGQHTGSDVVQVAEDYHLPDPDYWEEIMPQFDLDDATVEADLIVEEVSCNMIESEPENDVSQWDDKSCVEDCFGWLCASTLYSASLCTVQLRPDGILDTSMITSNFNGAVGFPNPED